MRPAAVMISVSVDVNSIIAPARVPVPLADYLAVVVTAMAMVVPHNDGPFSSLVTTTRRRGDQSNHANNNDTSLQQM